jgi:hypothetical protein
MNRILAFTPSVLVLVLAACSPASGHVLTTAPAAPASTQMATPPGIAEDTLARVDEQGAVTVGVQPLNLDGSAGDLTFAVSMNTHSVDLSMDLASMAVLNTDTGIQVNATRWDGPRGGHHISGTLVFRATKNGKSVLAGVSKLTLTISNLDAPTRVFAWDLR